MVPRGFIHLKVVKGGIGQSRFSHFFVEILPLGLPFVN